jgi:hypothetical protein
VSEATQAQREEAKRQAEIYDQDEKYMLGVIMWREALNEDDGTWPLEDTLIAWLVDRITATPNETIDRCAKMVFDNYDTEDGNAIYKDLLAMKAKP